MNSNNCAKALTPYVGRFAPSPTGLLHLGSLMAALASYLDAKAHHGLWLVRMEDLDPPREKPGAAQAILNSLQAHGLHWDGEVFWQSQQHARYQQCIDELLDKKLAFFCNCSRKQLALSQGLHLSPCLNHTTNKQHAVRLQIQAQSLGFNDPLQGHYQQNLATEVGDFVIQRKDKLFAYQLAVVLDDAYQDISHIVRGSDLLSSTPRQLFLQQQLGLNSPQYLHIPVITNPAGQKLSKQTFAPALNQQQASQNLLKALYCLNQVLPPTDLQNNCHQILTWAIQHWRITAIPHQPAIPETVLNGFAC